MKITREKQILDLAIGALNRDTEVTAEIVTIEPQLNGHRFDALIRIGNHKLLAEIKNWAQHANLGAIINQIKKMPRPGILVADYVNPNMAAALRAQNIQFVDTVGNAYIKVPGVYLLIKGNRQATATLTAKRNYSRAFGNTGLKVVFAFLCEPEFVNLPYRDIADAADVAVGTVGWVLTDLKKAGYVQQKGKTAPRHLIKRRQLLDRWVENYPEKLRTKQKIGDFTTAKADWWQNLDIKALKAYWGGEIAAAKFTRYLRPEIATVYVDEGHAKQLIAAARLRKANQAHSDEYPVHLYRPFWHRQADYTGYVSPVLAYADLIATAEPRNMETAQIIYDECLDEYLRED